MRRRWFRRRRAEQVHPASHVAFLYAELAAAYRRGETGRGLLVQLEQVSPTQRSVGWMLVREHDRAVILSRWEESSLGVWDDGVPA